MTDRPSAVPTGASRVALPGRLVARIRLPLLIAAVLVLALSWVVDRWEVYVVGLVLVLVGLVLTRFGKPSAAPVVVDPPVTGVWEAVNSPATRVPGHGTHAWGQTYALDLIRVPDGADSAGIGTRPHRTPPEEFASFGEPVLAVADGRVVRVSDRRPDQPGVGRGGYALFVLRSTLREIRGAGALLGNHVILDLGNGCFAAYAHLQRGSVTVTPGEAVTTGQQIARCGNSGNTTEPHLHVQAMDSPHTGLAAGIPMRFRTSPGDADGVVPANGERLVGRS